jgi:GTP cyclohydrolase I
MSLPLLQYLAELGVPHAANDNIADHLSPKQMAHMEADVRLAITHLLSALAIDTEHDPNTKETAKRVAKMLVRELYWGRYTPRPEMTLFPNTRLLDEVYTLGPITVRSTCSHHLVPIIGKVWVGVLPSERLIGISKFTRLAQWLMARPQIQEEATVQLADELWDIIAPSGLAVVMKAEHLCMTLRGVRDHDTTMVTSVMRGVFLTNSDARAEFLRLIEGQGYRNG